MGEVPEETQSSGASAPFLSEETIAKVADSSSEVRAGPGASPLVGQSREILEEAMLDKLAASSGSSHRLHRHTLAANPLWLRHRQS